MNTASKTSPVLTERQRWVWSFGMGGTGNPRVNLVEGDHIVKLIAGTSMQRLSIEEAQLIAAAPDLLAELQHLVHLMEPHEADGSLKIRGLATLNAARAAIAKAEGR